MCTYEGIGRTRVAAAKLEAPRGRAITYSSDGVRLLSARWRTRSRSRARSRRGERFARMSSAKRAKTEEDAVGGDAARVRGPWILYCTGNAGKFREASFVVDAWNERTFGSDAHPSRARLMQMDPDPTEIQGSADEIARSKVVQAWEEIRERCRDAVRIRGRRERRTTPGRRAREPPRAVRFRRDGRRRTRHALPERISGAVLQTHARGDRPGGAVEPGQPIRRQAHTVVTCTVASLRARRAETRDSNDTDDWFRTPRLFVGTLDGAILGPPAATSSTERRVGTRCSRPRGRTRRSESSSSKSRRRSRTAERRSTPSWTPPWTSWNETRRKDTVNARR